jgi:hypothetical protein
MARSFDDEVVRLPSMEGVLRASVPRAYMTNLTTNERQDFYINPETLDRSGGAKYNKPNILGMGNSTLRYEATDTITWSCVLVVSADLLQRKYGMDRTKALDGVRSYRAFFDSLLFPVASEFPGWVGGEPPRVRFVWPGVVSALVRVTSVKHKLEIFQRTLDERYGSISIDMSLDPKFLYWSKDVRSLGNNLV